MYERLVDFKPPTFQFNGHLQTIIPSFFRRVEVPYSRERLELADGDFLDLDWVVQGSKKLIVVTHGLEGDSSRHYVTGMIDIFVNNGYDGLAWNSRSCSGEINKLPRFYHHGDANDIRTVVEYAISKFKYTDVILVGYSMGGSLTLRSIAEKEYQVPSEVKGVMAASVPLDLKDSVDELHKKGKRFYMKRFIKKLEPKIKLKAEMFPDHPVLKYEGYYEKIKDFIDFDNLYTAPLHGYKNALDFYKKASVKPILGNIELPTLIIQALNDPFLGEACYDLGEASKNTNIELVKTKSGGHVGFQVLGSKYTFTENQTLAWAQKL